MFSEFSAIVIYFIVLIFIGYLSYRKHLSASDYIIGNRSMNFMLTALAAHASDMSSWLFMGYPAVVYATGLSGAWNAVGLLVFMFLNWQFVAPKIRVATEQYNSLTFSSFFESRVADTSGLIRIFTAAMSLVFYTIYISAGLTGLGLLMENLFGMSYTIGIIIGILIVIPYVFIGGYSTLAWIDLFQGIFLMCVIIFVPLYILPDFGGGKGIWDAMVAKKVSTSFFPNFEAVTLLQIFYSVAGWGLGYFGQPHIVTKFMGIKNVSEIAKSKYVGMSWMTLSLGAATLVGMVGVAFFPIGISDPEQIFIKIVRISFNPMVIGFFLCAILAATINAMSSQILVLSSNLTEDFYKRLIHKSASPKELLNVSRFGVVLVAIVSFFIALAKLSSIYTLVLYAWSGLGASFGPLLILSLYSNSINKYGAWAGILSGGIIAGVWPYFNSFFTIPIPSLIPGFIVSFILILFVSRLYTKKMNKSTIRSIDVQ